MHVTNLQKKLWKVVANNKEKRHATEHGAELMKLTQRNQKHQA